VERLCQLASNVLDRNSRQQASNLAPVPTAPIVIHRIRTGNHFHVFRRRQRRQRIHYQPVLPTLSPSPQPPIPSALTSSTHSSSPTNLTQPPVVPPSSPARGPSGESLVSLYWLFQDNINSSRTHIV